MSGKNRFSRDEFADKALGTWLSLWIDGGAIIISFLEARNRRDGYSPLDDLLGLPEAAFGAVDVFKSQHDWSLCALVRSLDAVALGHVGVDVAWAAGVDQDFVVSGGDGLCESSRTSLADSVCSRWPSQLFLYAVLYGLCKVLHEGGAVGDTRLGGGNEGVAELGRVFVELASHGADVDKAAAVADQGQDGLCRFEGAVVVCGQCLLDDVGVEAVHGNARIVDQHIDAVGVLFVQEVAELVDTGLVADVELVEGDGRVAAVLGEDLCLLELRVVLKRLDCFGASRCRPCAEVDGERAVAKRR